jgi:tryptophan synthase beta chain
MDAFALLSRTEGIIPAIESAHAVAGAIDLAREIGPDGIVLINVSGRGDKDMETAINWFGLNQETKVSEHRRRSGAQERSEPGVDQLTQPTGETGEVALGDPEPTDVNAGDIQQVER